MLLLLFAGLLSFIALGSATLWGMYDAQHVAMEKCGQIGADAGTTMETLTESFAKKRLFVTAEKKAHMVEREFRSLKEDTEYVAILMERILSTPEERKPKPFKRAEYEPLFAGEACLYYPPAIRSHEMQTALSSEISLASNIVDTLEDMAESYHGYKGFVCVASQKGYYFSANSADSLFEVEEDSNLRAEFLATFEPRETPWYKSAMLANKTTVDDIHLFENEEIPFVSFSTPYSDGREFAGIANISMNVISLYRAIKDKGFDASGMNFVLNDEGIVLYSSIEKGILSDSETNGDIRRSSEQSLVAAAENMVAGESGVAFVNVDGEDYYLAYAPIPSAGWSIGTLARADEVIAPAREARDSVLAQVDEFAASMDSIFRKNLREIGVLLILLLVVLVVASRKVAGRFVQPILALTEGVRDIARGDLDRKLNITTGDEIETLSESVNHMTDELKKYAENLSRVTAEKQKIATGLSLARDIQEGMLPKVFPSVTSDSRYEIFATMEAAKSVGGDFYDFYGLDEEHIAVTMADVSGKGIPAALFMMISKTILKNNVMGAVQSRNPETVNWAEVMNLSNRQLCENNEEMMFVTVFFGVLNLRTGVFSYVNCGHNAPLMGRVSEGKAEWQYIRDEKKLHMLGVVEKATYMEKRIQLRHGDMLYLYTDGVTEAMDEEGRLYSEERLQQTLNNLSASIPMKELLAAIRADIEEYVGEAEQSDDITMMGIRYLSHTDA